MLYGAQKGIFEMEKKEKDLISIIVPVYNAEKYITRCVQSILEQEYSNFELILIDDGSTDKSPKILSQLDKLDDRIMLLNQKNSGVSQARNNGLRHSSGSWIMFVDADDYIAPSALAKMFSIATKTSAVIVACEYYTCKNADRVASKFLNDRDVKIYSGDERINVIRSCIESRAYGNTQGPTNIGVPWAKLYRREVVSGEWFDIKLTHMEDTIFNINLMMKAKRITYVPEALYFYVIHAESTVHRHYENFEPVAQRVTERLHEFSEKFHLEKELRLVIEYKLFCLYYSCVKKQYFKDGNLNAVKTIKHLRRISGTYEWNGKYQNEIRHMYTKAQLLYGRLAKFNLFGLLYLSLKLAEKLKER